MKKLFHLSAIALLLMSCETDPYAVDDSVSAGKQLVVPVEHGEIVLGEKLDDPYTVENMTKALASLYPTKASASTLSETDLYVRFLPASREEYDVLESLGLELLDHPADYEIVREGDWYHDPALPEDGYTWQYCLVSPDFQFPEGIRYEILDHCFIAEHQVVTRSEFSDVDWDAVEREAFILTGNSTMLTRATKSSSSPSGRITISDPEYDSEPVGVAGVMVSCNVFVKFDHCYTDDAGYYQMNKSYTFNPRYRLVFKNEKGFGIGFNLVLIPASISSLGKYSPEGVSVNIDTQSDRALYCRSVVNNACYDYFNACSSGGSSMRTPPANLRIWLFQNMECSSSVMLQQGAFIDDSIISTFLGEYTYLLKMFLPDITLGLKGKDSYQSIYSVAQHECAHASHYVQVGNTYWNPYIKYVIRSFISSGGITYGVGTEADHGYCEVGEMWAYYIQTRLYRDRYPESAVSFGTSFWFSPQIFWNLDERGLDRFRLFPALTSDVNDVTVLRNKLLSMYPEYKSVINQAFDRYESGN